MTDPNELPIEPSEKGPAEPSHRNTEDLNLRVSDKTRETAQGSAQAAVEASETLAGEVLDASIDQTVAPSTQPAEFVDVEPTAKADLILPAALTDTDPVVADRTAARERANALVLAQSWRSTRRAFVLSAAAGAAGYGFYRWIDGSPGIERQPLPLRRAFETNAALAHGITREHPLAPTYSLKEAGEIRVNGIYGLKKALVADSWRLQLVGARNEEGHPRFTPDVTAWEYRYVDAESQEDQGHDTKVDPNARTSGKMAPQEMLDTVKMEEERTGRMPRGTEEAGMSESTLRPRTQGLRGGSGKLNTGEGGGCRLNWPKMA